MRPPLGTEWKTESVYRNCPRPSCRVRGTRAPSALLARRYRAWPLNCLSLGPSVAWCSSPFLDDGMRQMNWLPGPILKNLLLHGGHQCACRGPIFFSISLLYFQQGNRVLLCFRIFQRAVCTLIECALHSFKTCRQEHVLLAHLRALYS